MYRVTSDEKEVREVLDAMGDKPEEAKSVIAELTRKNQDLFGFESHSPHVSISLRIFQGYLRFLKTLASPTSQTYSKPDSTSLQISSVAVAALLRSEQEGQTQLITNPCIVTYTSVTLNTFNVINSPVTLHTLA